MGVMKKLLKLKKIWGNGNFIKKKNMGLKEAIIKKMELPNYSIAIDEENKEYRLKGGILGQRVLIKTGKKKAGYFKAKLIEIIEKSDLETLNIEEDLNNMSGNRFENVEYDEEIKIKKEIINELYKEINWNQNIDIVKSPIVSGYRNKMEYTFGDSYKDGPLVLGMHKTGKFYEISDSSGGTIANNDFDIIRKYTQEFFRKKGFKHHHKTKHEGELKFFVIRYSFYENAYMLNLVTSDIQKINSTLFDEYLSGVNKLNLEGKVISIYHTISNSISDAIKPDKIYHIFGKEYLTEKINDLIFRISPFSFFQPNPKMAEKLYSKAVDFAGDIDNKIVYDLYCGTGTISQIFAKESKKVIGVEIVKEAVNKAIENAKLNNLDNLDFRANDVLLELDNLREKPDIVVLDPPRSGIHRDAIKKILDINVDKIVYISCNPVTQVENLKEFISNGYEIKKIEAFDQFPRTLNVECVALMQKSMRKY